jgi:coproporphyrinogen III oxidase-like Fe-S oxidoreductase
MFNLAREYRVPEIYLLDPSFNVTPGLKERLELIVKCNTTHIPIHTEIRLEGVSPGIAKSMQRAGFKSVEAGLQSVNEKSLAAVGRTWDRDKFVRAAKLLQSHDIDVKTINWKTLKGPLILSWI